VDSPKSKAANTLFDGSQPGTGIALPLGPDPARAGEEIRSMSTKTLIFLGLVAAAGYALTREEPPVPGGMSADTSVAVTHASIGARFHYGLGLLGARMVTNTVTKSVAETEQTLAGMKSGIKKLRGGDAMRAKEYSKRVLTRTTAARDDLILAQPIDAIRNAMEAKNLLNAVRDQVERGF